MLIEDSAALHYFINEDVYLTKTDAENLNDLSALSLPAIAETPVLHYNYLGKNQNNFLIICSYVNTEHMDDKHLAALTSALQRKGHGMDDVAIVNLYNHPHANAADLAAYFKPTRLLLLGAQCLLKGYDGLLLNQYTDRGGYGALYTYDFREMMGDKDKTRAFWEQMKVL